jgi:integrase/recombinase XerD
LTESKLGADKLDSARLDNVQLDTFIDHLWLEDGLSKNTLESYRADLSQFDTWLVKSNTALLTANQADIQQYLAVKFPQSKPRSISRLIASMRRFYRYALRETRRCKSNRPNYRVVYPKV